MIVRFLISLFVSALLIVLAVLLGESGAWYLSWVLGTGFMILVAAAGGALLDQQEEARDEE